MSDCLKSADGVVLFADGAFNLSIERGTRTKFAPEKSSICIEGHCTKKEHYTICFHKYALFPIAENK